MSQRLWLCCRNSFITNFLIVCINVQASGTEYRCPFLSQTPPRLKNLPRFPFLSFASNGRKTNRRHHSFEFLYTAILLPAANINPSPDRPVVCCHLKLAPIQLFWGCQQVPDDLVWNHTSACFFFKEMVSTLSNVEGIRK